MNPDRTPSCSRSGLGVGQDRVDSGFGVERLKVFTISSWFGLWAQIKGVSMTRPVSRLDRDLNTEKGVLGVIIS